MLFNSYTFIFLFLPITSIFYYVLAKRNINMSNFFLLIASFGFYGYFNFVYLLLLVCSIIINYFCSMKIINRKSGLIFGIFFNCGILVYFKYMNFFLENINSIFRTDFVFEKLVLPLGINFFTFQQISYLIDCHKQNAVRKENTFIEYALFVSFFPQLIAGPIALHNELIPQFKDRKKKELNWESVSKGFFLFTIGLSKKVLLADSFGNVVNWGYNNLSTLDATNAFLIILGYTFEIYFDFSGYCDMASGIAKIFNIELPVNFDSPYKALDIKEFWQKWHMTLSRFLTKYIYIPLGGNRNGQFRTCINIMVVFVISGLWHGADWTFIVWGGVHGIAYILYQLSKKRYNTLHPALRWMLLFVFVNFTWVLFRAETIGQAMLLLKPILLMRLAPISSVISDKLFPVEYHVLYSIISKINFNLATVFRLCWVPFIYLLGMVLILGPANSQENTYKLKSSKAKGLMCIGLFIWCILSMNTVNIFLYFNF